ncbi:hypothetical protein F5Y18DRAFT_422337 [Xylariaceae sp. FL1019]|nr:hypothetical protein F5Y18DRAFT_422337 [Xylariaceae sp. FL1019]
MPRSYRVYIKYGQNNCVRFVAPGSGIIERDGLEFFEWVRDAKNIARLRNGLQHVYEIADDELGVFLDTKLRENETYKEQQMEKYASGSDMAMAFRQKRTCFRALPRGVDKLEVLASAREITTIPRTSPRKRKDGPGWLYLLDINKHSLEIYRFESHSSSARLTIDSLYEASPSVCPGYYIKLKLSELAAMYRSDWIAVHETHAEALDRLWQQNRAVLRTVPHADNIPFSILYASVFEGRSKMGHQSRRSTRLTASRLTQAIAACNNRLPSKIPYLEHEPIRPRQAYAQPSKGSPFGKQTPIGEYQIRRFNRRIAREQD